VLVSNIPAFSVLALKVIDSSMVSVSPDVDREGQIWLKMAWLSGRRWWGV
jgi:hypothetical protein